jgi:hypothetical protein
VEKQPGKPKRSGKATDELLANMLDNPTQEMVANLKEAQVEKFPEGGGTFLVDEERTWSQKEGWRSKLNSLRTKTMPGLWRGTPN